MRLQRSIIAIVCALVAAFLVQQMLGAAAKFAAPAISGLTGRSLMAAVIGAYLAGTISTAIAAGVALGRLAPMKPSVHVAVIGLFSAFGSYLLGGPAALPHGWQIVGFGVQLMLVEFVALRMYRPRRRRPAGFSARAA